MEMKKLSLAAGTAALLVIATGCSSGGDTPSGGPGSDAEGGTLTILDYFTGEPNGTNWAKAYDQCGAEIGMKIDRQVVPGANLVPKALQQASSKTLPDVLMLDNPDVAEFAQTGALAPLEEVGVRTTGFEPTSLDAGRYEGTLYGLAPVINTMAIFYNVDMFEEAGVKPPKTWDEMRATAKKLTGDGTYGFAFSGINTYEGTWQLMPWVWSNGGDEANIDSPEIAGALEFLKSMIDDGSVSESVVTWTQADEVDQFTNGKAAMFESGPWDIPNLRNHADLNWDSFPFPTRLASQTAVGPLGGETFTIPQNSDKNRMKKAAEFINCLASDQMMLEIAKGVGNVPSKPSVGEKYAAEFPELQTFVEAVTTARARTEKLGTEWPEAATKLYTAEQLALTGKETPENAVKKAADMK